VTSVGQDMVDPRTDSSVYVVLVEGQGYTAAYVHRKKGRGRAARRELVTVARVPLTRRTPLPDVLEAVAAQLRLPPLARFQPPPPAPGSPGGRWGANNPQP
jgi:hypothetical protein